MDLDDILNHAEAHETVSGGGEGAVSSLGGEAFLANMAAITDVSTDMLSWDDIPWPVAARPASPSDITFDAIKEFILSPAAHGANVHLRARLHLALLRWHPDKFEGRYLNRVYTRDFMRVKEAVGKIAMVLGQLLRGD